MMRGYFCKPRKPFFPILKRKIFLGIFGWKLLTIKSTGFVLFYFLWGVFFWRELTDYKSGRSEIKFSKFLLMRLKSGDIEELVIHAFVLLLYTQEI